MKEYTNGKTIESNLQYLKLGYVKENYISMSDKAAKENWSYIQYLESLLEGEMQSKLDRSIKRRIKEAHFPQIKTIDQFQWSWPQKINQMQIKNLFRHEFISQKSNVIFLGGVGLGKTHLAISLGYSACLKSLSVLFTTAIDIINNLSSAHNAGKLKYEMNKYLKPSLLIVDELGYIPIDKVGADFLFQVMSHRYERGSMIITTNRAYKDRTAMFNNDAVLTSAILDRVIHHAESIVIEGKRYRMKDLINNSR